MNNAEVAIDISVDLVQSADEMLYDEADDIYRLRYDPVVDDPSLAVVAAVAAVSKTSPADLEPLYGTVDPEALDELCSNGARDRRISFQYATLEVTVDGGGTIECSPPTSHEAYV